MTNEVAIKAIQDFIGWFKEDSRIYKALDMAIQALSQEPTVTSTDESMTMVYPTIVCEDAISREAVINAICDYVTLEKYIDNHNHITFEPLEQMINSLPSVTYKSGKWIDDGFYAEGYSHKAFHCSKCGHNVLGFKEDLSNYCPDCGARMESEK